MGENGSGEKSAISKETLAFGDTFAANIRSALATPVELTRLGVLYQMLDLIKDETPFDNPQYVNGSVRIPFSELKRMTTDEIAYLREVMHTTVRSTVPPFLMARDLDIFTDKDHSANVLQHELDHAHAIPEEFHNDVVIDIVFTTGRGLGVEGAVWYPFSQVSDRDRAFIRCAPASLSEFDANGAIQSAEKTGDQDFIAGIQTIVASKERIEVE